MSPEEDAELCNNYPMLFAQRHKDCSVTCMCWGFSCDSGWFHIINTLSAELENLNKNITGGKIEASQVKEKFGGLRFYIGSCPTEISDKVDKLIDKAQHLSYKTCEICGSSGKLRDWGWCKTLCDKCWYDFKKERPDVVDKLRKKKTGSRI